jgi:transcriptional regulator of acetoin/glycerol metabolism
MTREALEAALAANDGNATRAARSLGMARSQFYRELERFSIRRAPDDEK